MKIKLSKHEFQHIKETTNHLTVREFLNNRWKQLKDGLECRDCDHIYEILADAKFEVSK